MAKKSNSESRTAVVSYLSAAAITLICGGLVAGLCFGTRSLERHAAAVLDRHEIDLRIVWPKAAGGEGTWMPRACAEQITTLARDAAGESDEVLEAEQLERIGTALEQSGWYVGAPKVTRGVGGVILVDGAWRVPAANVRYRDQTYLVSWDGSPMPPGAQASLWIFDPALGPPRDGAGERDYSRPWAGEDMAASLELLAKVGGEAWARQVQGVDASDYSTKGSLTLITDRNTKVVWGGRPSKPAMGEVSTAQKMEHLRQLVRDTKRIDAAYPMIYVNQERLLFDLSATAMAQERATSPDLPDEPR
jgi:hypothetical protein